MFTRLAAACCAALVLLVPAALRAESAASPFLGLWDGAVVAGSGPLRTASLLVEEGADGALDIAWRNYEAGEDGVAERDRTLRLRPTATPGVYAARLPEAEVSAYIVGEIFTVAITAPTDDDRVERQIYRREVAGDDLTLHYLRLVDDAIRMELTGAFVRAFD